MTTLTADRARTLAAWTTALLAPKDFEVGEEDAMDLASCLTNVHVRDAILTTCAPVRPQDSPGLLAVIDPDAVEFAARFPRAPYPRRTGAYLARAGVYAGSEDRPALLTCAAHFFLVADCPNLADTALALALDFDPTYRLALLTRKMMALGLV